MAVDTHTERRKESKSGRVHGGSGQVKEAINKVMKYGTIVSRFLKTNVGQKAAAQARRRGAKRPRQAATLDQCLLVLCT